jgi:hypothetical protein
MVGSSVDPLLAWEWIDACTVINVPTIIDYPDVLARMRSDGFRCLYHNSGAFGFAADVRPCVMGWIGPDDPTIRPESMSHVRHFPPPYEQNLADGFVRMWRQKLPGPAWIMPASHWSYELEFGNADWLPDQLRQIGIDPTSLRHRNNAAAIEFEPDESLAASELVSSMLELLRGSDFTLAFPGHAVICTLHHHKQLWWQMSDDSLRAALNNLG